MKRWGGMAAILMLSAFNAGAQDDLAQQTKAMLQQMLADHKIMGLEGGVMGPAVTGVPYSADEIRENTQVLADGTRIHSENKVTVYRDSEGRIRRETPSSIEIWDPTTGAGYVLDPKSLTYQKMQVRRMVRSVDGNTQVSTYVFSGGARAGAMEGSSLMVGPPPPPPPGMVTRMSTAQAKKEPLDARVIEGLNCEGERSTSTIETGAIGNDRPISTVVERWYSPDLQTTVMTTKSDPRMGTEQFRLVNVRRGDPDPSLFQLPAGYQAGGPLRF